MYVLQVWYMYELAQRCDCGRFQIQRRRAKLFLLVKTEVCILQWDLCIPYMSCHSNLSKQHVVH